LQHRAENNTALNGVEPRFPDRSRKLLILRALVTIGGCPHLTIRNPGAFAYHQRRWNDNAQHWKASE
jgi:hypothetical protein